MKAAELANSQRSKSDLKALADELIDLMNIDNAEMVMTNFGIIKDEYLEELAEPMERMLRENHLWR